MSYTLQLIQLGMTTFVPFGDQIPGLPKKADISKNKEKARLATAKKIKQAVKEKKAAPSLMAIAKQMELKSHSKLAIINYSKKQYIYDQIGKASPLLTVIQPELGKITTTMNRIGNLKNLYQHAEEFPDIKSYLSQTPKVYLPFIAATSSPLWIPYITPFITTSLVGQAVATVVFTAMTIDGINYLFKSQDIQ